MRKAIVGIVCLVSMVAAFAIFSSVGCSKKSDPTTSCQSASECGHTYQACCSASNCHYVYNGKTYPCNGTDCSSAAQQLVADMCGVAKSGAEAETLAREVLRTMKCNEGVTNP